MHRRTFLLGGLAASAAAAAPKSRPLPADLALHFQPPASLKNDLGTYRSPLLFEDGKPVRTEAQWRKRREEILRAWHGIMGPWPAPIAKPRFERLSEEKRENFIQHRVRVQWVPDRTTDGYLLVPEGARRAPAVIVVFYEPETGIGVGGRLQRDFALQLARRGFVTLSVGHQASHYYPSEEDAALQPLSANAYAASNSRNALAQLPEGDPDRIGITGHSYRGKRSMFASCLDEKFACAAWSDGGIVWDELRSNVNFWEPWYLGWEKGKKRTRGLVTPDNPRTGAYKRLVEEGRDLHELHALMAPRPFLVSGGSEDGPERWKALNHSVAVNRLLGYHNRVAMTNRPMHDPTPESNEVLYRFFEWALAR
jgi:hypothetical protein